LVDVQKAIMESCDKWAVFFRETMRRLAVLRRRVREGVGVDEAHDFASYLLTSSVGKLMCEHPPGSVKLQEYFPYDGRELEAEARALLQACCAYWVGRTRDAEGTPSGANKSDLEAIERKQDLALKALAALESAKSQARRRRRPALRVVKAKERVA
jgi:hypothetical protein